MSNTLLKETVEISNMVVGDNNVTLATVNVGGFIGVGSARRNPDDDHDPEVGSIIAFGRALKDLGGKLEKAGHQASAANVQVRAPSRPKRPWSARCVAKACAEAKARR